MIKGSVGLGAAISILVAGVASAMDITGAGATFPAPVYAKWAESFRQQGGGTLNYQAIGSGGGIKQIKAKTVDFGASDMPMKPQDLDRGNLFQFPTVIGGILPVVNVPGVKAGELKLSGTALADIFLGKIAFWDDPALTALNPRIALPHAPIQVVHRAEGSGTTFVFTSYLSLKSKDWKDKVGAGTDIQWPKGFGGKGNDGVAAMVRTTPGAIGYVEYAFARPNHLSYAELQSASGQFIEPDLKSFTRAAASADFTKVQGFAVSLLDQPGQAWPITSPTYILIHKTQANAEAGAAVLKFFDWAYKNGDAAASQLDYVPLPANVKALVRKGWASQIADKDGKAIYLNK